MKTSLITEIALYAVVGTAVFAFAKTRDTSCPFQPAPLATSGAAGSGAPSEVKAAPTAKATIRNISAQQAGAMMKAGAAMVDVREPAEWETAHVKGSTLIPLSQVLETPKKAALAPKVLLMCHSGRRAAVAARAMKELPGARLFVIDGGITAWQGAGLPTVQGK